MQSSSTSLSDEYFLFIACDDVQAISSIEPAVLPSSHHKIEASIHAFDEHIDTVLLMKGFEDGSVSSKLTPARFVHTMRQKCIANPQRIVLPESNDHRILSAAAAAQSKGLAKITLLGEESLIQQVRHVSSGVCAAFPASFYIICSGPASMEEEGIDDQSIVLHIVSDIGLCRRLQRSV